MLNLTPCLRAVAKYRIAKLNHMAPGPTQEQELLRLIKRAVRTRFGKEHGFDQITSVSDYQKQVPLRYYEDFWRDYWKPLFPRVSDCTWPGLIPYFPVSSGTTSGATKYIPMTEEMVRSNTKAGLDLLIHHVANNPHSRLMAGKSFWLGSSTELVQESPGVYSGDLSGLAIKRMPWWASMRLFPPKSLSHIKDWEEKIEKMGRASLNDDIRSLSGIPSWLLLFFKRIFEIVPEAEGDISKVYPRLEMLVHGGINFEPYYRQFKEIFRNSSAEFREVYPASEAFLAVGDRGYGDGMRMNLDNGLFFEFVPLEELAGPNPTRHWIANVQKDVNYAVILTTCAGLWSYVLGDTVRFVDLNPPRVLVTGRTSYYLSAFGEHLIAEEIEAGVSKAASAIGKDVRDYSVGAVFPTSASELGSHLYVIEFADEAPRPEALKKFSDELDRLLCERNEDYAAHRNKGFGLNPPQIKPVRTGFFSDWMKSRGKLGGQNKVPRIITKQELFENLLRFE